MPWMLLLLPATTALLRPVQLPAQPTLPPELAGLRLWARAEVEAVAKVEAAASEAAAGLQRILFSEDTANHFGARCLDGSPSGYYVREGEQPDSVAIFLQGGGLCVEPFDCLERAKGNLGSSKSWSESWTDGSNILSSASWNPFANWTHVFVPYCSGDVHIGTQRTQNIYGLQFAGHNTLQAIVSDLLNKTGLRTAKQVLLSGGSAGGIGTFQNADWLGEALRDGGVDMRGLNYRASPQAGALCARRFQLANLTSFARVLMLPA